MRMRSGSITTLLRQGIGKGGEVAQEERDLLVRAPLGAAAKEDHRGSRGSPGCELCPESVSADTTIRFSTAARSKIVSWAAARSPYSRR